MHHKEHVKIYDIDKYIADVGHVSGLSALDDVTIHDSSLILSGVESSIMLDGEPITKRHLLNWNSVYTDVKNTSASWNSVYTDVKDTSASWNSVYTDVKDISASWNSVYTDVSVTSGDWNSVYSEVNNTSASWDSAYTDVSETSGAWNSVYTDVKDTSASWDSVYSFVNSDSATNNSTYNDTTYLKAAGGTVAGDLSVSGDTRLYGHLTGETAMFSSVTALSSVVDVIDIKVRELSGYDIIDGDLSVDGSITVAGQSWTGQDVKNSKSVYTDVSETSGDWNSVYTDVSMTSGDWNSVYSEVNNTSASWNSAYTDVSMTSGDWNSVYSEVNNTSASWDSVFTDVKDTSASWDSVYTDVSMTSGDWNSVYSEVNNTSASWDSVYTDVKDTSASWDSVYTDVKDTSASWDSVYSWINTTSGVGYATLGPDGKLDEALVPDLSISETHVVTYNSDVQYRCSDPDYDVERGDIVIVTDQGHTLISVVDNPTGIYDPERDVFDGFAKLAMPTDYITSVNNKRGLYITLNPDDLDDSDTAHKFVSIDDKHNWNDTTGWVQSQSATNNPAYNAATFVNVTGDTITGDLSVHGDVNVGGDINMSGEVKSTTTMTLTGKDHTGPGVVLLGTPTGIFDRGAYGFENQNDGDYMLPDMDITGDVAIHGSLSADQAVIHSLTASKFKAEYQKLVVNDGDLEIHNGSIFQREGDVRVQSIISHIDDENTYLEFKQDQLSIVCHDVRMMQFIEYPTLDDVMIMGDPGNPVDIRIQNPLDLQTLFIDGNTGRIGVGTDDPQVKFDMAVGEMQLAPAGALMLPAGTTDQRVDKKGSIRWNNTLERYEGYNDVLDVWIPFGAAQSMSDLDGDTYVVMDGEDSTPTGTYPTGDSDRICMYTAGCSAMSINPNQTVCFAGDIQFDNITVYDSNSVTGPLSATSEFIYLKVNGKNRAIRLWTTPEDTRDDLETMHGESLSYIGEDHAHGHDGMLPFQTISANNVINRLDMNK